MWWSIVIISTVGYGDIAPTTGPGRAVGAVLIVLGVGIFSYLTGLMSTTVFDPEEDEILGTVVRLEQKVDKLLAGRQPADE